MPGVEARGEITEIGSEASYRTRTYPITIRLEKPAGVQLFAGMSVLVSGSVDRTLLESQQVFELPMAAVFNQQEQEYIWRVNSQDQLEKVAVITENMTAHGIRLSGDLHSGDTIVIAGSRYLSAGDQVEVLAASKMMR
jgi:multidrug efflux pump subunit AcrA (membrane-fusion protein)